MPHLLRHKVIITGTGRAGTTFLVQLLTELGLDTGYRPGDWGGDYHEHCHAGLERELRDPAAPYIVKNPGLCETLAAELAHDDLVIDLAIVPIRDLAEAAQSRIRIGGSGKTPGGLLGTNDEARQAEQLAMRFHQLVHTLAAHRIPTTFLHFPRFAQDADYTFAALRGLFPQVTWPEFAAAFARVARPELIHAFNGRRAADAGVPALAHRAANAAVRTRRHRRRWLAFTAVAAALTLAGWIGARAMPIEESVSETPGAGPGVADKPAAGIYVDEHPSLPAELLNRPQRTRYQRAQPSRARWRDRSV